MRSTARTARSALSAWYTLASDSITPGELTAAPLRAGRTPGAASGFVRLFLLPGAFGFHHRRRRKDLIALLQAFEHDHARTVGAAGFDGPLLTVGQAHELP